MDTSLASLLRDQHQVQLQGWWSTLPDLRPPRPPRVLNELVLLLQPQHEVVGTHLRDPPELPERVCREVVVEDLETSHVLVSSLAPDVRRGCRCVDPTTVGVPSQAESHGAVELYECPLLRPLSWTDGSGCLGPKTVHSLSGVLIPLLPPL